MDYWENHVFIFAVGLASGMIIFSLSTIFWLGAVEILQDHEFNECCENQGSRYFEARGVGYCHYIDGSIESEAMGCDPYHNAYSRAITETANHDELLLEGYR